MTYTTLDGVVLDLTGLNEEERVYFERGLRAYRDGTPWSVFMGLVRTMENPLLRPTGGRITQAVWDHPLFQALRDMEDRLGVQQGHLGATEGVDPNQVPINDEWISATDAADRKGVSLPGLHKAIERGDVIARPIKPGGTRIEVSIASLDQWEVNRVRQQARKRV